MLGIDGQVVALDASGLPLGIVAEAHYQDRQVAFPPSAFLLLYSDALIETADQDGNLLEPEVLLGLVKPGQGLGGLLELFAQGRQPLSDDLTLVWLSRRG